MNTSQSKTKEAYVYGKLMLQKSFSEKSADRQLWKEGSESCSVMSDSLQPHKLYSPWDSPGQNIGVGSLSLLQGIFPNPGMELGSPALQADSLPTELSGQPSVKKDGLINDAIIYSNDK